MDNVYHNPVTQAMIMIDSDNDSGGEHSAPRAPSRRRGARGARVGSRGAVGRA